VIIRNMNRAASARSARPSVVHDEIRDRRGRIAAICTCLCEFGCDILAQVEPSPMPSSSTR